MCLLTQIRKCHINAQFLPQLASSSRFDKMRPDTVLSLQECCEVVRNYLQSSNDFKILAYEENQLSIYPRREATTYFSIKIKISLNEAEREARFIVKQITNRKYFNVFSEKFKGLKDEYPDYVLTFAPSCYLENGGRLVVFEDLFQQGFALPNDSQEINLDQIKLTLQTLAKYHARTIIYEENKSQTLKRRLTDDYPNLKEKSFGIIESPWFKARLNTLNALIDLVPQNGMSRDFKNGIDTIVKDSLQVLKMQGKFRNVLCHGYMWGESVLFKYNDEISGSTPVDCKFINFELQHYSPPGFDVLQFIYTVSNRAMRKHNLVKFLQVYYGCLRNELYANNLDAAKILPLKEDFEISVRVLLPLVKLQTACFRQIYYLSKEFQKQLNSDPTVLEDNDLAIVETYKTDEHFNRIMKEAILELKDILANPRLTMEDCFEIIENKIGTTHYELLSYEIIPLGKIYGFLGDHNKLKIHICLNNEKRTLQLFAKFMPTNGAAVSIATDAAAFCKEMFIYQHFVPTIEGLGVEMIKECGVPCYLTRHNYVLIFDDFEIHSYRTLDPRKPYSYEAAKLIIKKLAKFHASSIILEEKLSEKMKTNYCIKDQFDNALQEGFFARVENHQAIKSMDTAIEAVEHELNLFADTNSLCSEEEIKIKVRKAYQVLYELIKPSTRFRKVVCHGDLWVSNILLQHLNEQPTDCRFIDYQICRYCPPAHDLLNFIHLTTNRSLRQQYLGELIDLYYCELSINLTKFGYNIEKILPYDNFMESIECLTPQAVCQTVLYFQLILTDSDLVKDYLSTEESAQKVLIEDRKDFITDMVKRDPVYKQHTGECIQDLREMCMKYF